jgi:hypothetical protein
MAWGQPGRMRKPSSPLGFELRSVQPVASRYTNYAIQIALYKKDVIDAISKLSIPSKKSLICFTYNFPCRQSLHFWLNYKLFLT